MRGIQVRIPVTLKWIGLALLGILIAAAVAVAASRLASRQIGLASEPISAGDALAPHTARPGPASNRRNANRTPAATTSVPSTTTPTPEPAPTAPAAPATESQPQSEGGDDYRDGDHGGHEGGDD